MFYHSVSHPVVLVPPVVLVVSGDTHGIPRPPLPDSKTSNAAQQAVVGDTDASSVLTTLKRGKNCKSRSVQPKSSPTTVVNVSFAGRLEMR